MPSLIRHLLNTARGLPTRPAAPLPYGGARTDGSGPQARVRVTATGLDGLAALQRPQASAAAALSPALRDARARKRQSLTQANAVAPERLENRKLGKLGALNIEAAFNPALADLSFVAAILGSVTGVLKREHLPAQARLLIERDEDVHLHEARQHLLRAEAALTPDARVVLDASLPLGADLQDQRIPHLLASIGARHECSLQLRLLVPDENGRLRHERSIPETVVGAASKSITLVRIDGVFRPLLARTGLTNPLYSPVQREMRKSTTGLVRCMLADWKSPSRRQARAMSDGDLHDRVEHLREPANRYERELLKEWRKRTDTGMPQIATTINAIDAIEAVAGASPTLPVPQPLASAAVILQAKNALEALTLLFEGLRTHVNADARAAVEKAADAFQRGLTQGDPRQIHAALRECDAAIRRLSTLPSAAAAEAGHAARTPAVGSAVAASASAPASGVESTAAAASTSAAGSTTPSKSLKTPSSVSPGASTSAPAAASTSAPAAASTSTATSGVISTFTSAFVFARAGLTSVANAATSAATQAVTGLASAVGRASTPVAAPSAPPATRDLDGARPFSDSLLQRRLEDFRARLQAIVTPSTQRDHAAVQAYEASLLRHLGIDAASIAAFKTVDDSTVGLRGEMGNLEQKLRRSELYREIPRERRNTAYIHAVLQQKVERMEGEIDALKESTRTALEAFELANDEVRMLAQDTQAAHLVPENALARARATSAAAGATAPVPDGQQRAGDADDDQINASASFDVSEGLDAPADAIRANLPAGSAGAGAGASAGASDSADAGTARTTPGFEEITPAPAPVYRSNVDALLRNVGGTTLENMSQDELSAHVRSVLARQDDAQQAYNASVAREHDAEASLKLAQKQMKGVKRLANIKDVQGAMQEIRGYLADPAHLDAADEESVVRLVLNARHALARPLQMLRRATTLPVAPPGIDQ